MGFSYLCLFKSQIIYIVVGIGYRYDYESSHEVDKSITMLELAAFVAPASTGVLTPSGWFPHRDMQDAASLMAGSGPWLNGTRIKNTGPLLLV